MGPVIPAILNLSAHKGCTLSSITVTLADAAGATIDLTGWTPSAEVREASGTTLVIDLAPTIDDGSVVFGLTDEQTDTLTIGSYRWDLLIENPGGEVLGPYIQGDFIVDDIITGS